MRDHEALGVRRTDHIDLDHVDIRPAATLECACVVAPWLEDRVSDALHCGCLGARISITLDMLLLFDVDGTLFTGLDEHHFIAMRLALGDVFAVDPPVDDGVEKQGRTDLEIARDVAQVGGVAPEQYDLRRPLLEHAWARRFAEVAPARTEPLLVPGIAGVVSHLVNAGGARTALVTGNLQPIARIKLERAAIATLFELDAGGYGSDAENRNLLPPLARRRAGTDGAPFPREDTILIGDTPRDIACARADGLRCIAVTSGNYDRPALVDADAVATSPEAVVEAIDLLSARPQFTGSV